MSKQGLKTLRGFTILEAVIAMVLTGLLVVLAMGSIRYYHRLFYGVTALGQGQSQMNLLYGALTSDMNTSSQVYYDSALRCVMDQQVVYYHFTEQYITRSNEVVTDTFHISCTTPVVHFTDGDQPFVENIEFQCTYNEIVLPISISKKYPIGSTLKFDK